MEQRGEVSRFDRLLVLVQDLRASNQKTKEFFPEAKVGDLWEKVLEDLLILQGVPQNYRNLFWELTDPSDLNLF